MSQPTKRQRRRIAIYDPFTAGEGGLYRCVQGILGGLDPDRYAVTVFCHPNKPFTVGNGVEVVPVLPYSGEPVQETSESGERGTGGSAYVGNPLARYMPTSAKLVAGYLRSAVRISLLFRGRGFDLVHTFETDADPAALGAKLAGVTNVLYTYQVDSTYRPESERRCLGRRLNEIITDRCLRYGIAASERTRQDRLKRTWLSPRRIVMVPNGIDTDRFTRRLARCEARRRTGLPDDGRLVVGTVGRLHVHKGQEFLIRALAKLGRSDVLVAIVGAGDLEGELKRLAGEMGVAGQIVFLGQRSDVRELLEAMDVFALPSICEAMPYALLEAMSLGVASVATDVGGVAELMHHGHSGLVVPAGDVEALAGALARLLSSEVERGCMGRAARQRVLAEFNESKVIARIAELYERVLT